MWDYNQQRWIGVHLSNYNYYLQIDACTALVSFWAGATLNFADLFIDSVSYKSVIVGWLGPSVQCRLYMEWVHHPPRDNDCAACIRVSWHFNYIWKEENTCNVMTNRRYRLSLYTSIAASGGEYSALFQMARRTRLWLFHSLKKEGRKELFKKWRKLLILQWTCKYNVHTCGHIGRAPPIVVKSMPKAYRIHVTMPRVRWNQRLRQFRLTNTEESGVECQSVSQC